MRTLIIVALLGLAAALMAGCSDTGEVVEVARHEGCVTYRVSPGLFSNYVYYTVCGRGENVTTERTVGCGKGCTRQDRVETVWQ